MIGWRRVLQLLLCVLHSVLAAAQASPVDSRLVELELNGRRLPDFHDALISPEGRLFVPPLPLFNGAEAIVEHPQADLVRFALPGVEQSLVLDRNRAEAVAGVPAQFDGQKVVRLVYGQLLVDARILSELFGFTCRYDERAQLISVTTATPLPVEQRLLRERRWRQFQPGSVRSDSDAGRFVALEQPYSLLGSPQFTADLTYQQTPQRTETRLGSRVVLEAGYLTHNLFLNATQEQGVNTARWTAAKVSPEGRALGVDGLYRFEVGDVTLPPLPLAAAGGLGRGVVLSGVPGDRESAFGTTRIVGDAPAGWDAELYRGSVLVAFMTIGDDGRYRFEEIPLRQGANRFTVKLYGPQGERRELEIDRSVAGSLLAPGTLHWSLSASEPGVRTIELGERQALAMRGREVQGSVLLGASRLLTAGAFGLWRPGGEHGAATAPGEESAGAYVAGVTLRPNLPLGEVELALARDENSERALQLATRYGSRLGSIGFGYRAFDEGFEQTFRNQLGFIEREQLYADLSTNLGRLGSLSLTYESTVLAGGLERTDVLASLSHAVGSAQLTHDVRTTRQSGPWQSRYTLLGAYRHGAWNARANLTASRSAGGGWVLENINLSGQYRRSETETLTLSGGVQSLGDAYTAAVAYAKRFASFNVSLNASFNTDSGGGFGINLSLGGRLDRARAFEFVPPSDAGAGAVRVRVFHDVDGDGRFSASTDRGLEAIRFRVNARRYEKGTDRRGLVTIEGLSSFRPVSIEVDKNSIEDPFLVAPLQAFQLMPRPGRLATVDVPLQDAGAVAGRVALLRDGGEFPVAGLTVVAQLQDVSAELTTRTLSDGAFFFDALPPGNWTLALAEEDLPRDYRSSDLAVEICPGEVADGAVLTLERSAP